MNESLRLNDTEARFEVVRNGNLPVLFIGNESDFELVPLLKSTTYLEARERASAAVSLDAGKPQSMLFDELEPHTLDVLAVAYNRHVANAIQETFERYCTEKQMPEAIAEFRRFMGYSAAH